MSCAPEQPSEQAWQYSKNRRLGESGQPPREAVCEPGAVRRLATETNGLPEKQGHEKGGERIRPDAPTRQVDGIRKEDPEPAGCSRGGAAKAYFTSPHDGDTRKGGNHAVKRYGDGGRSHGIDSEELKYSCEQKRIEWRHPGAGAGVAEERARKSMARRERSGEPAGFPAELPVVARGIKMVAEEKRSDDQAQRQSNQNHRENAERSGCRSRRMSRS